MNDELSNAERTALERFLAADDAAEALEVVREAPAELLGRAVFVELERQLAAEPDPDQVAGLKARRDMLASLQAARDQVANLSEDERHYLAFTGIPNSLGMAALVADTPTEALDSLEEFAEARLAEVSGVDAAAIGMRLADLRRVRAEGRAAAIARIEAAKGAADRIGNTVVEWIETPDWDASQSFLHEHAHELVTDDGETVLQLLQLANRDIEIVDLHFHLVTACRAQGIDAAYAQLHREMEAPEPASDDESPLLQAVAEFLGAADDEAAQAVLSARSNLLLTSDTLGLIEMFLDAAHEQDNATAAERIAARLAMVQEARHRVQTE